MAAKCGAGHVEAMVAQEQRLAGAKPRRTSVEGVDALTPSERRVADLAAMGRTNPEMRGNRRSPCARLKCTLAGFTASWRSRTALTWRSLYQNPNDRQRY